MSNFGEGFVAFMQECPDVNKAFMEAVMKYDAASALDKKTEELSYIAVLAATRLVGGLPFHVQTAKARGATREEIKSAVLVGLPAVGLTVLDALPVALAAYDAQ